MLPASRAGGVSSRAMPVEAEAVTQNLVAAIGGPLESIKNVQLSSFLGFRLFPIEAMTQNLVAAIGGPLEEK